MSFHPRYQKEFATCFSVLVYPHFFYSTSVPISQHEKCPVKSFLSHCCTPAQAATDPVVTLRTGCIMLPLKHVVATATFYM